MQCPFLYMYTLYKPFNDLRLQVMMLFNKICTPKNT